MKISVIGTGYVGLVSGTCFSEMGNSVTCVDKNQEKIDFLKKGIVPIYEPGLDVLIRRNKQNKNLFFSHSIKDSVKHSDIVFIAVGTPTLDNGAADLTQVKNVAKEIGRSIDKKTLVVNKSTAPVGTCNLIEQIIGNELQKRNLDVNFEVVSNPEFLKEGDAVNDFMKPDRIVIGVKSEDSFQLMKELYSPFFRTRDRFIRMDIRSAEMTKYAANAMLATKISFINEIANICEKVGADVNKVRVGVGSDSRIGYNFIYPGVGYGGTCFPKDISALIKLSEEYNYSPKLLASVEEINENQKKFFLNKLLNKFGENLSTFTFGVWGLSFKPETDDMRKSPSIYIVKELCKRGAKVNVFDPKSMKNAKEKYFSKLDIFYGQNKYQIINNIDALILLTEWKEFRSPDFEELKNRMKTPIIFDGRNQYNAFNLTKKGFEYYQIGKNKNG